jgi:hypothetical protein
MFLAWLEYTALWMLLPVEIYKSDRMLYPIWYEKCEGISLSMVDSTLIGTSDSLGGGPLAQPFSSG